MKLKVDIKGASIYRNADVSWEWCQQPENGVLLKDGKPFANNIMAVGGDLGEYEIYSYIHKDKKTKTHWLVKNKILFGTGVIGSANAVIGRPQYTVEVVKEHPDNSNYLIVQRAAQKKLVE